jgi:ribosomal-protein-alanine N-acetyltransferase
MSWTIDRVRTAGEIDGVLAIEDASFSNPWTREMYLRELDNPDVSYVYALRIHEGPEPGGAGGTAVAFCSYWLVLDELHINNLAVHPDHRRRGYGAALLAHVLEAGGRQGAKRATLEVRRSNGIAIGLYERLGFRIAAVRPNYYGNPVEDALILWKDELPAGEAGA